jgi:hypothetical protein
MGVQLIDTEDFLCEIEARPPLWNLDVEQNSNKI